MNQHHHHQHQQHQHQQRRMMMMPALSGGGSGGIVELPYHHHNGHIDHHRTGTTAAVAIATAAAVVPPPGIPRRENSNLISINTADRSRSIWRGHPKIDISFKVKTGTYFLERMGVDPLAAVAAWAEENAKTKKKGRKKKVGSGSETTIADSATDHSNTTAGPPKPPSYTLFPSLVDCRTGAVYRHGHNNGMVRLRFADNGINADGSLASIDAAANANSIYHVLEATVDRDLFRGGDSFVLDIAAHREGDPEITFGRSPVIQVTNLALSIEENFSRDPHVHQITGVSDTFAWYSKCGGEKSGLQVFFSIKDEKGRRYNPRSKIPLQTELLYDDGDPAPLKPLAPVKKKASAPKSKPTKGGGGGGGAKKKKATASMATTTADESSDLPLFRPMVKDPVVLEPDGDSKAFSFRIEEVSFHHPNKQGFKLKVSPSNTYHPYIHPGVMEETLIVLSKPKNKNSGGSSASKTKRGGRKSILGDLAIAATGPPAKKKARKVSKEEDDEEGGLDAVVPLSALIESLTSGGKCLSCNKKVESESFFAEQSHKKTCSFLSSLFSSMSLSGVIASGAGSLGGTSRSRSSDGMVESKDAVVKEVELVAKEEEIEEETHIFEEEEYGGTDAWTSAAVAKVVPTVGLSSPSFAPQGLENCISTGASAALLPPLGAGYRTTPAAAAAAAAGPSPLYSSAQPRFPSFAAAAPLQATNETNLTMASIAAAASGSSPTRQTFHHYLPLSHAFPAFGAYDDPCDSNTQI